MAIHLDIITRLNERKVERDAKAIADAYDKAGEEAGKRFGKGLEKSNRDVEKANKSVVDSLDKVKAAQLRVAASQETTATKSRKYIETRKQIIKATAAEAEAEERLTSLRDDAAKAADQLERDERDLRDIRRAGGLTVKELAELEKLLVTSRKNTEKATKDAEIGESLLNRERTNARKLTLQLMDSGAALRNQRRADQTVNAAATKAVRDHAEAQEDAARASRAAASATKEARAETRKLADEYRRTGRFSGGNDSATRLPRSPGGRSGGGGGGSSGGFRGGGGGENDWLMDKLTAINRVGAATRFTGSGVGTLVSPLLALGAIDIVGQMHAMVGAIGALPAVAVAGGAAMGTLQLATMGFGDAIKDMGDPEKFATALADLAPNAQQAALSIQAIVPQLKELKNATQDSFFKDFNKQIQDLSAEYLPAVQGMTTSIAGSFNTMITDVANDLKLPGTEAQVTTIMNNISALFTNLEPVASSLASAFIDITEAGSNLLPELGTGAAELAKQFADFIREASQSGKLEEWISGGITAVGNLATAIWDVTAAINQFFQTPEENTEDFVNDIQSIIEVLNLLNGNLGSMNDAVTESNNLTIGADWNQELSLMTGFAADFRDMLMDIPEVFQNIVNVAIRALNNLSSNLVATLNMLPDWLVEDRPADFGKIPELTVGDWGGYQDPTKNRLPDSNGQYGGGPNAQRERRGLPPIPSGSPATQYNVPAPPPVGADGKPLSDAERRKQIENSVDPSLYKVDPYAQVPGLPAGGSLLPAPGGAPLPGGGGVLGPFGLPMPGGAAAPGGGYTLNQQDILEADHDVQIKAHDLQESKLDLLVMQKEGVATEKELLDQQFKITRDGWDLQEAQSKLAEKQRGTANKMKSSTAELGAAFDADFGLSEGLPGLAKNIVTFLGNLAAAPMLNQLQAIVDADPIKGGHGLLGIMGAQNIAAGKSPLLGNPLGGGSSAYGSTSSAYGSTTVPGVGTAAPLPGESARDYAHRTKMPAFQAQGYEVGDHAADKYGEHQNGALDIMVPSIAEGQKVLQEVLNDPSTYGAIFNNQVYGYGQGADPRPYSGGNTGDPSQDHTNHVHALYKPGDPRNINPNATGGPSAVPGGAAAGGFGGGSGGVQSVFVVNMPGGGGGGWFGGGGGGGAAPAPGGGGGAPAGAAGLAAPGGGGGGLNWDALAGLEASGDWHNRTNPKYSGGLQFDKSTWDSYGGGAYGNVAADATREQQIEIAKRAYDARGGGSTLWPENYKSLNSLRGAGGGHSGGSGGGTFNPSSGAVGGPIGSKLGGNYGGAGAPLGGGSGGPILTGIGAVSAVGGNSGFGPMAPGAAMGLHGSGGSQTTPAGPQYGPFAPTPLSPGGVLGGPMGVPPLGGIDPTSPVGTQVPGTMLPNLPPPLAGGSYGGAGSIPNVGTSGGGGPGVGATKIGADVAPYANPGGGGGGITPGGSIDTAIGAAASALDVMAPGAGQAAQVGIKLAGRAIQYGAQAASIGVGGLLETFVPTGGSELANNNWITRIAGGIAGARPALPNTAGGVAGEQQQQQQPGPLTPQQVQANDATKNANGDQPVQPINIEYNAHNQTEDENGKALANRMAAVNGGGMAGKGIPR